MYWLILVTLFSGPQASATSTVLHVGTFGSMADCQNAAKAGVYIKGDQSPMISFLCVNSGTLSP
jgi:hypothetical protein